VKASIDSKRPADSAGNAVLRARTVRRDEYRWFDTQLDQQHPLGAGRPVGDYLLANLALLAHRCPDQPLPPIIEELNRRPTHSLNLLSL